MCGKAVGESAGKCLDCGEPLPQRLAQPEGYKPLDALLLVIGIPTILGVFAAAFLIGLPLILLLLWILYGLLAPN